MRVRDWMTTDPIVVDPGTEVREARRLLHHNGIRHLPVVDDGRLVGIVSDRDVRIDDRSLRQLAALQRVDQAAGEDKPVDAVMSPDPQVIDGDEPVADAARLMLSRRISALPVVDDGALVGIITTTDCMLALLAPDPAALAQADRHDDSVATPEKDSLTSYGTAIRVDLPFVQAVDRVKATFQEHGFGTLTEIDVQATLADKLGEDIEPYTILGVCNPQLAHQALSVDRSIGLLLPCTVVVREGEDATIVEALDPQVMVGVPGRAELQPVADAAAERITAALADLTA